MGRRVTESPTRMKSNKIGTTVGLGVIIGAGIFTLSGTTIALAGVRSLVAFVLVGFVFVAIVVALGVGELCYRWI